MVTLVEEREEHAPAVERLLDVAFGEERWHKTCQRLRDGQASVPGLSLVALARDSLVGTVRLWPVLIGRRRALLLGPLAVDPAWQDQGVGAALMDGALARAKEQGEEAVVLVGDAPYYGRFGFKRNMTKKMWLPGPVDRRRFLGRELKSRSLADASGPVMKMAA